MLDYTYLRPADPAADEAALVEAMHVQAAPVYAPGDDEDYTYEPVQVATISPSALAALRTRTATLEAAIWQTCRDWSAAPLEAQWWAADCDGQAYWYECKPARGEMGVWKSPIRCGVWVGGVCPLAALGIDWSDTLTRRPTEAQP